MAAQGAFGTDFYDRRERNRKRKQIIMEKIPLASHRLR